jgi:prepilin-type N-terminal cleavage/methylation domain-containing protein
LEFEPDAVIGQKRVLCKGLGFTLMEVLVSLAVLGVAVTIIFQLFSANLGSISASGNYVAAVMQAESRMRQVLDDDQLKEQSLREVTDDGYRTDITVSEILTERTENLRVKLMEVDLTIHWQQGSKEKALTIRTFKVVDKL